MSALFQCPTCQQALHIHQQSQGLHCDNKHHFDRNQQGYWVFGLPKKRVDTDSRQVLRAKKFMLASGMFDAVVEQMATLLAGQLAQHQQVLHCDLNCGDGFYIRALAEQLAQQLPQLALQQWGLSEAENALFAATKTDSVSQYFLVSHKTLPFVDNSLDLVTVIDQQLKGKEAVRVLKPNGLLLTVSPGPRHLWQLKQHIYPDLTEKPFSLNLPKTVSLVANKEVRYTVDVSGENALTLLDTTPYAWRANDKARHEIGSHAINQLEFDFVVTLAVKQA